MKKSRLLTVKYCHFIILARLNFNLLLVAILCGLSGCENAHQCALKNKRQTHPITGQPCSISPCPTTSPYSTKSKPSTSSQHSTTQPYPMDCHGINSLSDILNPEDESRCDHALDLAEILDWALERNPATKIAWHQIKIAEAQKAKAENILYPHIDVGLRATRSLQTERPQASAQPSNQSNNGKKYLTASTKNVFYPQIGFHYVLFKFGTQDAILAARNALNAVNLQYHWALQEVAYKVELAYFALNMALAIVRADEQNLGDAKVALDAAQNRHQSGLTNRQDQLKAQAVYSSSVFELENSRSMVETTRAQLANIIGIPVNSGLRITESNPQEIPDMGDVEHLITEALNRRQDLQAQHETVTLKEHLLNVAKSDYYPELFVDISASRRKTQHTPGMYNHFDAIFGLKWDLFDGYLKASEALMAREEMKIARQQLRSKIVDVASQVWEYFYALKSAIQKLEAAKEAENCALEAFQYTKEAYSNGLSSFTDLSTSQSALSSARKQLVRAHNDNAIGRARLAYAMGRILER